MFVVKRRRPLFHEPWTSRPFSFQRGSRIAKRSRRRIRDWGRWWRQQRTGQQTSTSSTSAVDDWPLLVSYHIWIAICLVKYWWRAFGIWIRIMDLRGLVNCEWRPINLSKRMASYWIHSIFSFHYATAVKGIWVASATAHWLVPLFTVSLSIVVTNSSSGAVLSANQSPPVLFIALVNQSHHHTCG